MTPPTLVIPVLTARPKTGTPIADGNRMACRGAASRLSATSTLAVPVFAARNWDDMGWGNPALQYGLR